MHLGVPRLLAGLYPTPQYNNGIRQNFGDGAIETDHLAFDGNNGGTGVGNTAGDGVVVFSIGSKVDDCQFVNIAGSAVCAVDRNYYGTASPLPTFENRIVDNVIINPRNYGVWVTDPRVPSAAPTGISRAMWWSPHHRAY